MGRMRKADRAEAYKGKKKVTRTGNKGQPGGRAEKAAETWELKLYVAGKTPKSVVALANLKAICEEKLKGRYRITVVNLIEHPEMAFKEQIVVIPTLMRELPPPLRKIIGDLSKT